MNTPRPATASSSIVALETGTRTQSEQVVDLGRLHIRTAELRDSTATLAADVTEIHESSQEIELAALTQKLESSSPVDLLDEMADDFVFPWAVLARVIGVTPAAIRKWRRGETVTPGFHHSLAAFVAFCRLLRKREPRIENVARWMEMPAAARSDITRVDLYIDGHRTPLLDMSAVRVTGEQVLDDTDPAWRDRAARSGRFKVLRHEDGSTSIVPRTDAD